MDSKKKQNGYWDNFANVELELLAFIEECGTPSIMPKNPERSQARRFNLAHAVHKHGGYAVVAKRLGLTCVKQCIGHWDDFSSVESEVFLSALGELRLPLDEVLSLLTSKLLWQAFYKRLYNWYGGLNAAQNVTDEDVEAAIFSTYPEHTDNEFIAEASARFALEVEQAVNFAASLADYGWHGPRLRLHQADAAHKMAEILSNQDDDYPFVLNADDPGMGKSASFLAAVCVSGVSSVVLIAPKTVADDTWCSKNGEIRRCLPDADIVRGLAPTLTAYSSSGLTFYVLHYEELLKSEAIVVLTEQSFDCLCLDEIHFVKQRAGQEGSQRRVALTDLRARARAAIGLTREFCGKHSYTANSLGNTAD